MATASAWPNSQGSGTGQTGMPHGLIGDIDPAVPCVDTVRREQGNDPAPSSLLRVEEIPTGNIDSIVVPLSAKQQRSRQTRTFNPAVEWEGYVEDIGEEDFTVRLVNANSESSVPEEVATFSKSELSDNDRILLMEGAIVRWTIGLERLPTGQRRRVSQLYFRNLPAHSARDLERARAKQRFSRIQSTGNEATKPG